MKFLASLLMGSFVEAAASAKAWSWSGNRTLLGTPKPITGGMRLFGGAVVMKSSRVPCMPFDRHGSRHSEAANCWQDAANGLKWGPGWQQLTHRHRAHSPRHTGEGSGAL